MDFQTALREQCVARGGPGSHHVLKVIDMPDSPRRTRILARMEQHARVHLVAEGAITSDQADVDWADKSVGGSIDWKTFFAGLLQLLTTILPLILQFIPK